MRLVLTFIGCKENFSELVFDAILDGSEFDHLLQKHAVTRLVWQSVTVYGRFIMSQNHTIATGISSHISVKHRSDKKLMGNSLKLNFNNYLR